MTDCNQEKVKNNFCTCTYSCSRRGKCCECVQYHIVMDQLPGCFFAKISKQAEQLICVVYWIFHYKKLDEINQEDIEETYKQSRIKKPSNLPREIRACISNGWLIQVDEKKYEKNTFILSTEGEEYVESLSD